MAWCWCVVMWLYAFLARLVPVNNGFGFLLFTCSGPSRAVLRTRNEANSRRRKNSSYDHDVLQRRVVSEVQRGNHAPLRKLAE